MAIDKNFIMGYGAGKASKTNQTIIEETDAWLEENISQETGYVLDRTLTLQNAAAPADMVGDLKSAIDNLFTSDAKTALLNLLSHVAYIDDDGEDYYNALLAELLPSEGVLSAVFDQTGINVWSDDSLDSLKDHLTVSITYPGGSSEEVTTYTLSGNLNNATSTITVTYGDLTTTFTVLVRIVGSENIANALSTWVRGNTKTVWGNGVWTTSGLTQSEANQYGTWLFDRSAPLWSSVNGKTVRIRVTESSPDWEGEISTTSPMNKISDNIAIFENATTQSGSARQKYANLGSHILTSTPTVYEYVFTATIDNFPSGSGTPTDSSTFGFNIYINTVNTVIIHALEIVEVLN